MNHQQEIGGAEALLQLGSKKKGSSSKNLKLKKSGSLKKSSVDSSIDSKESHYSKKQDAVENQEEGKQVEKDNENELDANNSLNQIEDQSHNEEDMDSRATNQQINDAVEAAVMRYVGGNLENDERKSKKRINPDEIMSNMGDFQNWTGFLDEGIHENQENVFYDNNGQGSQSQLSKPKKKKRRASSHHNEIDPELSGLDSNLEHEQLVRAAILETRELAKQLGSTYTSLNNLSPLQAHQVISALQNNNESVSNINHLVQSGKEQGENQRSFRGYSYKELGPDQNALETKNFSHLQGIDHLSNEARKIAIAWYKDQPESKGPRPFSKEEQKAVEFFIEGFCYLFKMDRKGVCNRIWTTERKKDNFWESLTRVLPYRSRASVYKHVRRQYHVFDVRGKWSPEDDDKLSKLAATREGNWKEIGSIMGRMPEDCRDRWRNYIKCGNNRVQSKWSPEEEMKLKEAVSDMLTKLKMNTINWTLISEAMNGSRSRIQCRYKWNKLVKRESIARIEFMELETKLWLFEKIKALNYQNVSEIDWNLIAKLCNEETKLSNKWLPSDFQYGFDRLKSAIKDTKFYTFPELINELIEDCIEKLKEQNLSQASHKGDVDKTHKDQERDYLWR